MNWIQFPKKAVIPPISPLSNVSGHVRSLPDMAYGQLREAILSGAFQPGKLLRQEDIASQLGVSRLPVREALRRLESEGLVVLRPRRGFMVAHISRGEIVDIFEARAVLESRAGYLATQVRTNEDVRETRHLLDLSSRALLSSDSDFQQFYELNVKYHDRLLRPLRRPHLKRLVQMMRNAGERYIRMSVTLSEDLAPSAAEHQRIYDAYAAGEADEVARLCHEHCVCTMARLLKNIEKKGLTSKTGLPGLALDG